MEAVSVSGKNTVKNSKRHIVLINSVFCCRPDSSYYASFSGYVYRESHKFYPECTYSFIYLKFMLISYR